MMMLRCFKKCDCVLVAATLKEPRMSYVDINRHLWSRNPLTRLAKKKGGITLPHWVGLNTDWLFEIS